MYDYYDDDDDEPRSLLARPWRLVALGFIGLVGLAVAFLGLALSMDLFSLRRLAGVRQLPMAEFIISLRNSLARDDAHTLEAVAGAAGLLLLAAFFLVLLIAAIRFEPESVLGWIGRVLTSLVSGVMVVLMVLTALPLVGIATPSALDGTQATVLRVIVRGVWNVLQRLF
jgi:hypothetical protein